MEVKVITYLGDGKEISGKIALPPDYEGEILVVEDVTPDILLYLPGKKALICSSGILAHAVIVALEFNIPVFQVSKEDLKKIAKGKKVRCTPRFIIIEE